MRTAAHCPVVSKAHGIAKPAGKAARVLLRLALARVRRLLGSPGHPGVVGSSLYVIAGQEFSWVVLPLFADIFSADRRRALDDVALDSSECIFTGGLA